MECKCGGGGGAEANKEARLVKISARFRRAFRVVPPGALHDRGSGQQRCSLLLTGEIYMIISIIAATKPRLLL